MAIILIPVSLVLVLLIIDRIHKLYTRRQARQIENYKAKLDILKVFTKQECFDRCSSGSFEVWFAGLLEMLGYSKVTANYHIDDRGFDFSCFKNEQSVYIECKLWDPANFEQPVQRSSVQKLVGAMVGDGIQRGMVITASHLTDEARDYIEKLPRRYRITFFDGETLMKKLYDIRKVRLEPLLEH